jgi:hypothetical protein
MCLKFSHIYKMGTPWREVINFSTLSDHEKPVNERPSEEKHLGRPSIKRGLGWEYSGCKEQQPRSGKNRTNKVQRDA